MISSSFYELKLTSATFLRGNYSGFSTICPASITISTAVYFPGECAAAARTGRQRKSPRKTEVLRDTKNRFVVLIDVLPYIGKLW